MIYLGIFVIGVALWMTYEIWRAPLFDYKGNLKRPTRKLKDLFKKKP